MISVILALLLTTSSLSAKELYAFIAADTTSDIKESCKKDMKNVIRAMQGISRETGMHLQLKQVNGKSLTKKTLDAWLESIKPGSDDVIYFHFSGHGLRARQKKRTRWPEMAFTSKNELIPFKWVINEIGAKKARLAILICDTCNTNFFPRAALPEYVPVPKKTNVYNETAGIKKLFLKTKGLIAATASAPGKVAWNSNYGGLFTNAFLVSLQQEVYKKNPQWEHVFKSTRKYVKDNQKPGILLEISKT